MNEMKKRISLSMGLALIVILLFGSCSAVKEVEQLTVEKRFAVAKSLFDDRDYLQAYEEFRIVTLQYQGNALRTTLSTIWENADSRGKSSFSLPMSTMF
jgi:outer membrane protein assembly factor BamD (BamD/ComL family)